MLLLPAGLGSRRPVVLIPHNLRQIIQKKVVAPVELGALLHAQPAPIPFISSRGVRVQLLLLQREVEEFPPHLPYASHQLRPHAVVHHLEETPLAARARYPVEGLPAAGFVAAAEQGAEIDGGNVGVGGDGGGGGAVGRGLDVPVGEEMDAAVGEGLNPYNRLRPALNAIHGGRVYTLKGKKTEEKIECRGGECCGRWCYFYSDFHLPKTAP